MVQLTLFEIHLDGAEFTANAPGSDPTSESETPQSDAESGGPPTPLLAVLGFALLVALGVAIRRKIGGTDDSE